MTIEEIYKRYRSHIYRLCRRYVRNPQDANDIVQTVFLKAMKSLGSFDQKSGYFTWLYRIAVNECLNHLKKNRKDFEEYNDSIINTRSNMEFIDVELSILRRRLFRGFDKKEQKIILLHIVEGMPIAEIAEILQVSRQAIHRKWNRIKSRLHKKCRGIYE